MKAEDCWWDGCNGSTLYPGRIAAVDFNDVAGRFFLLHLDEDEEDIMYHMRYDAVVYYADAQDQNYHKFKISDCLLEDPEDEEITLSQLQKMCKFKCPAKCQRRLNRLLQNADTNASNADLTSESDSPDFLFENNYDEADTQPTELESDNDLSIDSEEVNTTIFELTEPEEWHRIGGQSAARNIEPVPYAGEHEEFCPNIDEERISEFKDTNGDIRFEKVFEWLLPRFGDGDEYKIAYFEFIAARIRNYMLHIIKTKDYKPKYYNPAAGLVVLGDHIARFMGCHQARML
jgi:hypothetical protein